MILPGIDVVKKHLENKTIRFNKNSLVEFRPQNSSANRNDSQTNWLYTRIRHLTSKKAQNGTSILIDKDTITAVT